MCISQPADCAHHASLSAQAFITKYIDCSRSSRNTTANRNCLVKRSDSTASLSTRGMRFAYYCRTLVMSASAMPARRLNSTIRLMRFDGSGTVTGGRVGTGGVWGHRTPAVDTHSKRFRWALAVTAPLNETLGLHTQSRRFESQCAIFADRRLFAHETDFVIRGVLQYVQV